MQSSIFWPRDQSVDDQGQMQSSVYWERDQAAGGQGQSFQGGPSWPSELTNQGNMSNEGHMQGAHAWSRGEGGNSGHFQSGIFWSVPQYGQPVEPATGGYLFKDNESDQIKHVEPIQHVRYFGTSPGRISLRMFQDTYEQNSGKGRQVNNLVSSRDQRPHYQSNSDEALNEIQVR